MTLLLHEAAHSNQLYDPCLPARGSYISMAPDAKIKARQKNITIYPTVIKYHFRQDPTRESLCTRAPVALLGHGNLPVVVGFVS